MDFQIGDLVRFLNEKGEGIIKSIDRNIATVEIEDGFDIPVVLNELVRVHSTKPNANRRGEERERDTDTTREAPKPVKVERALANSIAGEETVYLAFVPEDDSKLLSSPLQVFLVNNTSYQVVYSYATSANNEDTGIAVGYIYPNTEKHLHTVSRSELDKISSVLVQLLFHNKSAFKVRAPIQQRIAIKGPYFNNLDKLKSLGGINKHAFLMTVAELNTIAKLEHHELFSMVNKYKKENTTSVQKAIAPGNTGSYIKSVESYFKALNNEIEVDLHIEELTESFGGMSNADIVEFQLDYFRKIMDKAITSHVRKIVFIHGVGNGTLKREVRNNLKNYKGIKTEDGASNKYGAGATQVVFTK